MKILQVNDRYNMQGGTEEYVKYISHKLVERGHEVHVLFEEGEKPEDEAGLFFYKALFSNLPNDSSITELIKSCDVANIHNIQDPNVVASISKLLPTVRYIHDHRVFCPGFAKFYLNSETPCPLAFSPQCVVNAYTKHCATRKPWLLLENVFAKPHEIKINQNLKSIIVASSYMKNQLLINGFDAQKIEILPDPLEFETDEAISYGDFILFVGRITIEKGLKYLLQAVVNLPPDVKLKVVGDGPELAEDKSFVEENSLRNRVEFLGWLPFNDISRLYANCRFLVFPSIWPEPYGRTGPEAMLFKKPVVGFDVGGVGDWLIDGENGLLAKGGDIEDLSRKIQDLWTDLNKVRTLGETGYTFIKGRVDPEKYMIDLEKIYQSL